MTKNKRHKNILLQLKQMWINQPSTSQPDHALHGTNVLAYIREDDDYCDAFAIDAEPGKGVGRIARLSLSPGWKEPNPQRILSHLLILIEKDQGCSKQSALRDLLTDLFHVAKEQNLDMDAAFDGASEVFQEEL